MSGSQRPGKKSRGKGTPAAGGPGKIDKKQGGDRGQPSQPSQAEASARSAAKSSAESSRCVTSIRLSIKLLEDMHAGSGLGGGSVDALLARDRRGCPVIRWSHQKGLLAQALRDRCDALGEPPEPLAHRLFGRPDRHGLGRGLIQGLSLREAHGSGRRGSLVVASTARARLKRTPLEDTLRQVEYVRKGTSFDGEIRVTGAPDGRDAELLLKLLKRVTRIGASRTRGDGLIHVTTSVRKIAGPPEPSLMPLDTESEAGPSLGLCVLLRALEPVCLGATGQPGNQIPTHSHVAPPAVTGLLVRWALDMGWNLLADALLAGEVVCGAAYPFAPASHRTDPAKVDVVPMPLSYLSEKPGGQAGRWPWWAGDEPGAADSAPTDALASSDSTSTPERRKRPGAHDYLVRQDGEPWQRQTCPIGVSMRNDAGFSLNQAQEQQLFAVEEIAEDTRFAARILVPSRAKPVMEAALRSMRDDGHWLRVGRSGAPLVVEDFAWVPAEPVDVDAAAGGREVRLFVETDLVLRTDELGFHERLDRAAVHAALREAGVVPELIDALRDVQHTSEPAELHGWNIATGAPRLVVTAIRRGSMAIVRFATAEAAAAVLRQLASCCWTGIGERTDEGYGRVRANFAPAVELTEQTSRPVGIQPEEQLLERIDALLDHSGFPVRLFSTSRWQALRSAAAAGGQRLDSWWASAERLLDRRKAQEKITENAANQVKDWLALVKREAAAGDSSLLVGLGLQAAKLAKRQRAESLRDPRTGVST